MSNKAEPAFPLVGNDIKGNYGLTKREYFAAHDIDGGQFLGVDDDFPLGEQK
jgi:hypothetical protein